MRTNNIYCVTIAKYSSMFVEANNPTDAMNQASKALASTDYDFSEDFDGEEIFVDSVEKYTTDINDVTKEPIYTVDGELSKEEYLEQLKVQES